LNASQLLKKHKVAEGDHVSVTKSGAVFKGTIIPSSDESVLVLKMDNGYNVGLDAGSIDSVEKLSSGKRVAKAPSNSLQNIPGLPTILILHTGGTIASRVDYRTGAVFASFNPEDLVPLFPGLEAIANFESRLLSKMWSEDMRFPHYSLIAKEIGKEIQKNPSLAGIIIAHGTDTMHYSSAALAFAIQNSPIPIIFVGAQRSSDRGSSDAHTNMLAAANFIVKSDFSGVAICMHETSDDDWCAILPACKTRKMHSSRRDAFQPINDSIIARVHSKTGEIQFVKTDYLRKGKRVPLIRPDFADRVALVKLHTHFSADQLEPYLKYDGLVLEGMALGHAPIAAPNELSKPNLKNREMLEKILQKGCVVAMASQCLFGRVHMHVYDKAVDLANMGVVGCEDMLPETAFVKLAWLLGNFKDKDEVKRLIATNLVGEISAFTPIDSHV